LHIIGKAQPHPGAEIYYRQLMNLVRQHVDWITLEENISREELAQLAAHHRYGIHGMSDEHFGVAVAEMVRGGCVVFVLDSGGQVEIVGEDRRLRYNADEEAAEKIARVLEDANAQEELRNTLAQRAKLFTTENFMNRICEIVAQCLDESA